MKKALITAMCIALSLTFTACGSSKTTDINNKNEKFLEEEKDIEEEQEEHTETDKEQIADKSEKIVEKDEDAEYHWDAGKVAYLGFDRNQILEIYDYYMGLIDDPAALELMGEDLRIYEDECVEKAAEKYGITTEDIKNIFYASLDSNYFATFDVENVKMRFGESESVVVTGGSVLVSDKITPGFTNKSTIEKCYFDACDFIRDYVGMDYKEVIFAGYAGMTDGSEQKFIQFTVPKYVIDTIANGEFADNTLGDHVDDLWIMQSLRD